MQDEFNSDKMGEEIQKSLADAKWEQLNMEFGMLYGERNPNLPPHIENEFLDHVLEFERQFAEAKTVTVRERIGNPALEPPERIKPDRLEEAIDQLLQRLIDHGIAVDFVGSWDYPGVYHYLYHSIIETEIDDIRIPGMFTHYTPTSADHNMAHWLMDMVRELIKPTWDDEMNMYRNDQFKGINDLTFDFQTLWTAAQPVWGGLTKRFGLFDIRVEEFERLEKGGKMTASISWPEGESRPCITSSFCMAPEGEYEEESVWLVLETSLLEDLLTYNQRRL